MLMERYIVEKLEVFGSYPRDEQNNHSDLDLLITFKEDPSLLTFIAIENYLYDYQESKWFSYEGLPQAKNRTADLAGSYPGCRHSK